MSGQWVHLEGGSVLAASSTGAWLQQPQFGAFGLMAPMPPSLRGEPATTRHLLDGAIAAAERFTPPGPEPPMTPRRWAWLLVNQWHTAHHSVALLPLAIERYDATNRPDLAAFAERKLEEEQGHDQFPLNDLRALGYDAAAVVGAVPVAPMVRAMVEHARTSVLGASPVDFVGYVYALERRVIRISEEQLAALDALLPPGVQASTGVRAHATVLDIGHVEDMVTFVAGLPTEDRILIARSAHRTTAISCASGPDQHPSDADLARWLDRFQRAGPVDAGNLITTNQERTR